MNVWSAPAAMIGNKRHFRAFWAALGALVLVFPASGARADASMMGLAYVNELLVQPARLANQADSDECGLLSNDITDLIVKKLKVDGIPAFSLLDAPQPSENNVRIDLFPEIVTMNLQGMSCVSYVSLSAQGRTSLPIPPVHVPRNVTITYWRGGLMLSSAPPPHKKVVDQGIEKLSELFSREYRLSQPPVLPSFDERK